MRSPDLRCRTTPQFGATLGRLPALFLAIEVRVAWIKSGLSQRRILQNLRLLRHTVEELRAQRFDVFVHRRVPANDGGLFLGQAVVANAMMRRE
jgi:hypothetical protein